MDRRRRVLALRSQPPELAPSSLWLIGADDGADDCTSLYSDSRDVSHASGVWSIRRHGKPFA
jgi:hypothetical protein